MKRRIVTPRQRQYQRQNINHHPWQQLLFRFSWSVATFLAFSTKISAAAKSPDRSPEVSSTLLKLHKIYTSHPPHDTSLYDTLWISPNATHADVQKSYRKLSRQFHPDKQRHQSNRRASEEALERIRHAYEILNDDATRLPYHKYGLEDLSTAVLLLTGYQNTPKVPPTFEQMELLQLMGYHYPAKRGKRSPPPPPPPRPPPPRTRQPLRPEPPTNTKATTKTTQISHDEQQDRRVQLLAATILERIRPFVEGTVPESTLVHAIWQDCDRLKTVPLGAQIIRCVGRAYRHVGRQYLRRHYYKRDRSGNHPYHQRHDKKKLSLVVSEPLRDKWHDAKHLWTAAVASGRVTLQEKWRLKSLSNSQKKNKANSKAEIAYHDVEEEPRMALGHDEDDNEDDFMAMMMDDSDNSSSGDEYGENEGLQLTEAQKAEKVIIELLQVEALWKVHKIGIDRSVRAACDLILSGQYFFFPSNQQQAPYSYGESHNTRYDGWVSTSHSVRSEHAAAHHHQQYVAIDAEEGRLRAAKALVLVGDAMVSCSKDGTAWME